MPWTPETPYVLQSYRWDGGNPDELFHATEADQIARYEQDKKCGFYQRLWRGKGTSADHYSWETLDEWMA